MKGDLFIMKLQFVLFLSIVSLVYGLISYYMGLRGWQAFGSMLSPAAARVYWVVFLLLAASYWIGRTAGHVLPGAAGNALILVGSYWLGVVFYSLIVLVLVDLARLMERVLKILPEGFRLPPFAVGFTVLALIAGILIYGTWNARDVKVRRYDLDIDKKAGSITELHMVAVSDLHLGSIVHGGRLDRLISDINRLDPDLVLLPGDIIDETIGDSAAEMLGAFSRLKPPYGIYACFGNHEYISGKAEEAYRLLEEAGVVVLRDEYAGVGGSFYIVGRDDLYAGRLSGKERTALGQVMSGIDRSFPVILLDHQPFDLDQAREAGVDLQLSGHTHLGQLFPNNYITRAIYERDWGYLRKESLQVIVSCGFGTWGPPIRTGSKPEIVDIMVRFAE